MLFSLNERFIRYNANIDNKNSDDCVKRALSLAYNKSYVNVSKELIEIKNQLKEKSWASWNVYHQFMTNNGLKGEVEEATDKTVEWFCENYPVGTYILTTHYGLTNYTHTHMTCIIDGNIYDTWDCSKRIIYTAYIIDDKDSNLDTSFSLLKYKPFVKKLVDSTIKDLINKSKIDTFNYGTTIKMNNKTSLNCKIYLDCELYNKEDFSDSFNIQVSYKDLNIDEVIEEQVITKCKNLFNRFKQYIRN